MKKQQTAMANDEDEITKWLLSVALILALLCIGAQLGMYWERTQNKTIDIQVESR